MILETIKGCLKGKINFVIFSLEGNFFRLLHYHTQVNGVFLECETYSYQKFEFPLKMIREVLPLSKNREEE